MDPVHVHLMVNHVSFFATVFSMLILGWSIFKKNDSFFSLAMIGLIIAGVFSLIAMQSGEAAEDIIENMPGISEALIHNHEEVAEVTNWITVLVSFAAATGLFIQRKKPALKRRFEKIVLLLVIISTGFIVYTAYLGGQIRHTEIHPDQTALSAEQHTNIHTGLLP